MPSATNTQIRLARRPTGAPERSDFEVVETPVPSPAAHEVLVRTRYLSVDPYMRSRMRGAWDVGSVLRGGVVGEVVESRAEAFEAGDLVTGSGSLQELEWATYTLATASDLRPVETGEVPVSTALGVLGMPGRTAYFGTFDVGRPRPGDTVVVSGAAGAVGSVAGQLASLAGGRVVGVAGSTEKLDWLTGELGFDAGVDYRTDDLEAALADATPDGVDVYFDNVGGPTTDAVVGRLNDRARMAVCGQIAHYNDEGTPTGPRLLPRLHHTRVEDFTVSDFAHRYGEANARLRSWVADGTLGFRETVTEGLGRAPEAFLGLFEGENVGKQLVEVG